MTRSSVTSNEIPGGWSEREFVLCDRALQILLPADPDEFLERLEEESEVQPGLDPYWAELWPTSLTMAQLIGATEWPDDTNTLELGCGIGIVGLAAMLAGMNVTFTDCVALAVETAMENAHRNGLSGAKGFRLDWHDPPKRQVSVLLASDVLYDRDLHQPLLNTINVLLADQGVCWLGDPGRSAAASFLKLEAICEFDVELLDASGSTVPDLHTGEFRVIRLKRRR